MRVSTFNYNLGMELLYRNPVHLNYIHMIYIAMCISKDYLISVPSYSIFNNNNYILFVFFKNFFRNNNYRNRTLSKNY